MRYEAEPSRRPSPVFPSPPDEKKRAEHFNCFRPPADTDTPNQLLRSIWFHYLVVIIPENLNKDWDANATLYVTGGSNTSPLPTEKVRKMKNSSTARHITNMLRSSVRSSHRMRTSGLHLPSQLEAEPSPGRSSRSPTSMSYSQKTWSK